MHWSVGRIAPLHCSRSRWKARSASISPWGSLGSAFKLLLSLGIVSQCAANRPRRGHACGTVDSELAFGAQYSALILHATTEVRIGSIGLSKSLDQ